MSTSSPSETSGASSNQLNSEMALPFDHTALRRNAENAGFSREEGAMFAHLALQQARVLHEIVSGPITIDDVAASIAEQVNQELNILEQARMKEANKAKEAVAEAEAELERLDPDFAQQTLESTNQDNLKRFLEMIDELFKVRVLEKDCGNGSRKARFEFSETGLKEYFGGEHPYDQKRTLKVPERGLPNKDQDIVTKLCRHPELAVELSKQLRSADILNLYIGHPLYFQVLNGNLLSTIRRLIKHKAPIAGKVFPHQLYRGHLVPDPAGWSWQEILQLPSTSDLPPTMTCVRTIPGLKYLQLVLDRDRYCRDIAAIMARSGLRMPAAMHKTLLLIWLLMDLPTTHQRLALIRNEELWTETDLYNAQFFFIKLGMLFNDPVYGPNTNELVILMMGQKGLYPLWQLICRKRFTTLSEVMELAVRYNFELLPIHWGEDVFEEKFHGVPFYEIGIRHLEGWGQGKNHLMRPDELVPLEAVRRGLELDKHLIHMVSWGFFDWTTGENLVPTEDEMYLSDEEQTLAEVDTTAHWRRKHVLKKRFHTLSREQQRAIVEEDEDERLRAMAFCGDIDDYSSNSSGDGRSDLGEEESLHGQEGQRGGWTDFPGYKLDDEINRGFIVRPQPKDSHEAIPSLDDADGWRNFVNEALLSMPPDIEEDESLAMEAWQSYGSNETDFDWPRWLQYHQQTQSSEHGNNHYQGVVSDVADFTDTVDTETCSC